MFDKKVSLRDFSQISLSKKTHGFFKDLFAKSVCLKMFFHSRLLHELQSCKEDFPEGGRLAYSSVTMIIQYLLPTITISVAYYQVETGRGRRKFLKTWKNVGRGRGVLKAESIPRLRTYKHINVHMLLKGTSPIKGYCIFWPISCFE